MFDYIEFPPLPIVKAHLGINCAVAFLAVLVVVLRLVARFTSGAGLWWDDYLILVALPQALGMLIIQGMWSPMGVGYDMPATLPNLETILKLLVAYELIYTISISTVKISVMLFYLRVFVNRELRIATKAALAFVGVWTVANILQVFLICRPFAKTYTLNIEGECGDQVASYIAIGAFNIVTDVMIIALPLPTVWSLRVSTPAKLGLTGVFVVGLLVSVIAIIRIVTLTQLDLQNLTGTMVWADFWSATEPLLAVLCVSLPMLGTLWSRCIGGGRWTFSSRRRTANKYYPGGGSSSDRTNNTAATRITPAGHNSISGSRRDSKFNKLRSAEGDGTMMDGSDTHIPLESIYAANHTVRYQSAVETGPGAVDHSDRSAEQGYMNNNNNNAQEDKESGSEVALTTAEQRDRERELDLERGQGPAAGRQDLPSGGIRVQTKWSITRN